jgi:hypothetical protein
MASKYLKIRDLCPRLSSNKLTPVVVVVKMCQKFEADNLCKHFRAKWRFIKSMPGILFCLRRFYTSLSGLPDVIFYYQKS